MASLDGKMSQNELETLGYAIDHIEHALGALDQLVNHNGWRGGLIEVAYRNLQDRQEELKQISVIKSR